MESLPSRLRNRAPYRTVARTTRPRAARTPLGAKEKSLALVPRRMAASALVLLAWVCLACTVQDAPVRRGEYRAALRSSDGAAHGEARLVQLERGIEFVVEVSGLPARQYLAELRPSCAATEGGGPSSLRLFVGADGTARSRRLVESAGEARELGAMRVVIVPEAGGATVACGELAEEQERPSP